ncbi:hypothetical protein AAG570_012380 [Ranatra chinensis]|uniref:Uncharacterized protein n=1 Tax=Ranatra chinensis TaxID=642074 RepID=A0ABD0Z0V7_9HEMI
MAVSRNRFGPTNSKQETTDHAPSLLRLPGPVTHPAIPLRRILARITLAADNEFPAVDRSWQRMEVHCGVPPCVVAVGYSALGVSDASQGPLIRFSHWCRVSVTGPGLLQLIPLHPISV